MKEIRDFILGFKKFQDEYYCVEDSPFDDLKQGQSPSTMVIACSDSRTDPSLVMQCGPGEIFVVRNIANLVPPYEPDAGYHGVSSAIEYAVTILEVANIIILGHSSCGGVKALMSNPLGVGGQFVGKWLSVMGEVRDQVLERFEATDSRACKACEMAGVLRSLDNLMTFPWLAERVKAKKLRLHGWYFDMEQGRLLGYQSQSRSFEPLAPPCGQYDK